ncbi:uncharacterized protein FOMMEDRAFT_140334 [Fomitiporia mediterranea MF3/22]|uniref:uncharacterized protein n=1 Tax=Fomitiporia mediterranea (strain MF3/22) TaxID=694068 RepID=UPI0004407D53|nr:uncharacterized protein FOMMEDRAFT_140334 [Fomitiporia mediterranea MF3/22]EJD04349.1 hypothetical protein FOMMEDRAFT_140334 [Fomitiporia mediterranea MF3/22]
MEQFISPELLTSSNPKQSQQGQQHQQQQLPQTSTNLDFFSFTTSSDILAPHPDLFESELDSSLAGFDPLQLQSLIVDQPDAFNFLRSDTPTCGPPSTITVSSESASAYETLSSYSESLYNQAPSNYSFPFDLDMDFARASINAQSDYASARNTASGLGAETLSDYSYEASRHSPASSGSGNISLEEYNPRSPANRGSGSVYSGYDTRSDYYPVASHHPSLPYSSAISPSSINQASQVQPPQARAPSPVGAGLAMSLLPRISRHDNRPVPRLHPVSQMPAHISGAHHHPNESIEDPRKKYQCNQCPRAFARAYNLKTHMATHDPLRPKPFTCNHAGCGRSFSRKHDLGRHLVSIHRDESATGGSMYDGGSDSGSSGEQRIGVASMKEGLHRCDACGKSGPKKCACKHDGK